MIHYLTTPMTMTAMETLHCGDKVYLSGTILTARDAAHQRLVEALQRGETLPVDLTDQILFYAGPTPTRPGEIIGSIGPTTSSRMDRFLPALLQAGIKATIGKGNRSAAVRDAMQSKAIYLVAIGGAAVVLAESIRKVELLAYPDLGPEAIYRLSVENFPCYVAIDLSGHEMFQTT